MMPGARDVLESVYRTEQRRVRATLIRLLGGFDAADEAIDRWRRELRIESAFAEMKVLAEASPELHRTDQIEDDELRLIFTCCHPSLSPDARIALTLREVCGLTTEEIARAWLVPAPTIAQRIVRAKAKIRDEALPYEVPEVKALPERLESALKVVYLIYNEGYLATQGPRLTRADLCVEALRLSRLMAALVNDAEALGLVALMLLHESRRAARTNATGDLVLLENQDRSSWDRGKIKEAQRLIEQAMALRRVGPYVLQALIASVHVAAPCAAATDWAQIVSLYDVLYLADPSPVVGLNRAIALGMRDGPGAGLAAIEAIAGGALNAYHLAHAARADMQRRLGLFCDARASYRRAVELTSQPAERLYLQTRLAQVVADCHSAGR